MKNILLPTDLSVQSLWTVKKVIEAHKGAVPITIHVVHMLELPSSIGDLLLLGRTRKSRSLPYHFKDALQILQGKFHGGSVFIRFDFVYGSTSRLLQNYLTAKNIEEVIVLDGYQYKFQGEDAVNFLPLFKKLKTPVKSISCGAMASSDFQVLSILLNDDQQQETVGNFNYQAALAG